MRKYVAAQYANLNTIVDFIQKRAEVHPDKVAFTFLENSEEVASITYKELDLKCKAIATELRKKLSKGDRALLLYKPGLDYITGFFGCLYAGVIAVPAYPPDPSRLGRMLPRLLNIVDDCTPKMIMTTSDISSQLKLLGIRAPSLFLKSWMSTDKVKIDSQIQYVQEVLKADDISFLQYTSGSTGNPKGVMVTHQNIMHNSESINRAGRSVEDDRLLAWLPLYHDMGLIGTVIQSVYVGVSCWVMSPFDFLKNPYNWLYSVSKYKITGSGGPNFAFHLCQSKITDEQKSKLDLSHFKMAYCGAEPVRSNTIELFIKRFSDVGFKREHFYPCYGLAESTVFVSMSRWQRGYLLKNVSSEAFKKGLAVENDNSENVLEYVSSGTPLIDDTYIKIVNPETRMECKDGEVGEIWISSPSVAPGYWGKVEYSKEIFDNYLKNDSRKYMRSGDLAFSDGTGELFLCGRMKDLIIVNGQNHYPSDIEETVLKSSPEIRPGCLAAVAIKDQTTEKVVLVTETRKSLTAEKMEALRSLINRTVYDKHELSLADIVFIRPGSIPKTTSGKIQRNATKLAYLNKELSRLNPESSKKNKRKISFKALFAKNESPETVSLILSLIAKETGKEVHSLNSKSEFSEIGLSSLQAVSIANAISEKLKIEISPALFWNYRTVESLSDHLTKLIKKDQNTKAQLIRSDNNESQRHSQPQLLDDEIAIVGMSCRFPGANSPEEFWKNLTEGVDSISQSRGPWAGYISGVEKFDPLFFGISPREAEVMDPQQRLSLQVVWESLERSGIAPGSISGSTTGVFFGVSSHDYADLIKSHNRTTDLQVATGNAHSIVANRISFLMNLRGPSLSIDTACSSSLVAVHEAVKALKNGDCHLAIAGGVNVLIDQNITDTFARAGMLSVDGRCFTFDKKANGYVRGEGVGAVILKPLKSAIQDGNPILAVIRGSGIQHGGHTNSLTAPSAASQAELIENTYRRAKIAPQTIGYIEAHGTATKLGDPIELLGLQTAFENLSSTENTFSNNEPCLVGSVKSNIGHLEAAAGIAGLIKSVLILQNKKIPGTLHFNELNPNAKLNNKVFKISGQLQNWPQSQNSGPRRAGISSFGFGGMNAHLVIEEFSQRQNEAEKSHLPLALLISAKSEEQLFQYAQKFKNFLTQTNLNHYQLEEVVYTSQVSRDSFSYRLAVFGDSVEMFRNQLEAFIKKEAGSYWVGQKTNSTGAGNPQPNDFKQAVKQWVQGQKIHFEKFYNSPKPKVFIPTYPFAEKSFWIGEVKGQSAQTTLSLDQFFIKDHVVVDRHILPGVAHLELARKSAKEILFKNPKAIKNVFWLQPVVVGEGSLNLAINFTNVTEDQAQFEIVSQKVGTKPYSKGIVEFNAAHLNPNQFSYAEFMRIKKQCETYPVKPDVYEHFSKLGLNYGNTFQCIKKMYSGSKDSFAELSLDPIHENEKSQFQLHPSLMDAALGACIGIQELAAGPQNQVFIPFSLDSVEIYGQVQETCFAYAKLSADVISLNSDHKKYDVTVFSAGGTVLVQFFGVVVRPVVLSLQKPEAQVFELVRTWETASNSSAMQKDFKEVLLVNCAGEIAQDLKNQTTAKVRELQINPAVPFDRKSFSKLLHVIFKDCSDELKIVIDVEKFLEDSSLKFLFDFYGCLSQLTDQFKKVEMVVILKQTNSIQFARQAELRGFVNSLKNYHSQIALRLVTFDQLTYENPNFAKYLLETLRSNSTEEASYSDGKVQYSKLKPVSLNSTKTLLKTQGVYIISGGTGGIGQILAQYLEEKWQAQVYVLGRSEKSNDLTKEGKFLKCDVGNRDDVRSVLKKIRQQAGFINGIIHAAGSVSYKSVIESSWSDYQATLSPKVQGSIHLDEETADDHLDFFMVTSSLSSLLGDFSAGDYASANAFLDEFVKYRENQVKQNHRHGRSLCINWPLWESGGMSMPNKQKELAEKVWGFKALPTPVALELFEKCLSSQESQTIVVYGNAKTIKQNLKIDLSSQDKGSLTDRTQALNLKSNVHAAEKIQQVLAKSLGEILKIESHELNIDSELTEYGVDSMTMMDFMDRIKKVYGDFLTPAMLFENKTLRALSEVISNHVGQTSDEQSLTSDALEVNSRSVIQMNLKQPLSQAQQAMWFIYELAPESFAYHIPVGLKIRENAQVKNIKRAIELVAQEQPQLRTIFSRAEKIEQFVLENCGVDFEYFNGQGLSESEILEKIKHSASKPFQLLDEPGFRALCIKRDAAEFDLILTAHHIVFDGLSLMLLLKKFISQYQDLLNGPALTSIEVDTTYFKFIQEQESFLSSSRADKHLEFWKNKLAGEIPVLNLPLDKTRPSIQTYNGKSYNFDLNKNNFEAVKELAKKEKVTVNSILLSAYYIFLSRYSGQDDIVVGTPVLGRSADQMETIGYFVNILALRERLEPTLPTSHFLKQVQANLGESLVHQSYPFPLLVDRLKVARDPARSPLFQACFVFQNMLKDPLFDKSLGKRQFEYNHIVQQEGQFDLEMEILDSGDTYTCHLKYNSDLFFESTVKRFAESYQTIIESILKNPVQKISDISALSERAQKQVLHSFNDTRFDYKRSQILHSLFEEQVTKTPNALAVKFKDQSITYQELNTRANQVARYLVSKGIQTEDFVGVCMNRSVEMVVALYGILKAGAAYVPIEPSYPQARLEFLFKDSEFKFILTQENFKNLVSSSGSGFLCLDSEVDQVKGLNGANLNSEVKSHNLAYMIYTSGSTGQPKGAMNTHEGICNRLLWMQHEYQINSQDRILQKTPFSFDVSVWEFFWPLITGASLIVLEPEGHKDAQLVADMIKNEAITTIHFVPSMLGVFLEQSDLPSKISSLKRVICSGEALPMELQNRFFEVTQCELHNLYGPTEASVDVTYWPCKPDSKLNFVPIGKPIHNMQIYIVDSAFKPVPIGVGGELCIAGIGLARGYHNRPELNQEKFIPNPFSLDKKSKLYRTGDLARFMDDGQIEYLGRIDNQIKIRGFRIEVGEIEFRLSQNPVIKDCVVVARTSHSAKELVAYLVKKNDQDLSPSDLRNFLKKELPEFMIPSQFVFLNQLPLSANGKVDRKLLPEPKSVKFQSKETLNSDLTPVQKQLADIWKQVLEVPAIAAHDHFFDLGGNSLLTIKAVMLINQKLNCNITVRDFYESSTVEALAVKIESPSAIQDISDVLLKDAVLDSNIRFGSQKSKKSTQPKILLTGATGFLGAYLLRDLLEQTTSDVHCLVRCQTTWEGLKRVQKNLEKYSLWKAQYANRIYPVKGDLGLPQLGLDRYQWSYLAQNIECIYHNGAKVNFVQPYSYLKNENVLGTHEVLRLCSDGIKKSLHYVSTVSVFDSSSYSKSDILDESTMASNKGLFSGYAQSKWVAEQIVQEAQKRGLEAKIYRPGTVSGDSTSGISNPDDLMTRLLVSAVQLKCWPQLDRVFDLIPVNFVSRAIFELSTKGSSPESTYHLVNPKQIHLNDLRKIYDNLGFNFNQISYDSWLLELVGNKNNALHVLLPLFSEKVSGTNKTQAQLSEIKPPIKGQKTFQALQSLGLSCPEIDEKLIGLYLEKSLPLFNVKKVG